MRDTWNLLRAGALHDAQTLCRAAGMPWLAAAIGAGLWDDPQLRTFPLRVNASFISSHLMGIDVDDEKKSVTGTQSLDLWLEVCSRIANEVSLCPVPHVGITLTPP